MELHPQSKMDMTVDSFSKYLSLAFKLSTFLGGLYFVLYCLHLDYFPTGISIGDSIFFIIFAACFGLLYSIVTLSLLSLSVCVFYCFNPFIRLSLFIYKKLPFVQPATIPLEPFKFVKPDILHFMLSTCGILFIVLMSGQNLMLLFQLSATLFLLSIAWTLYKKNEIKYAMLINEPETPENLKKQLNRQKLKYFLLGFIFLVPISLGGISLIMLEAGMKFSNLKKRASYVLIQPPYSHFIPESYKEKESQYNESGYTTFKGINVMLTGIGQKTVIQFPIEQGKKYQSLEIPNDKIIIIPAHIQKK